VKILVDMNLAPRWVRLFLERGVDAVHWKDTGPQDAPDIEIMEYAARNGYVILTRDLDFGAHLAAACVSRPSVVQIRIENVCPETLIVRVIDALSHYAAEVTQGALITVNPRKTRVTLLPL
jgi:predicted nuclease of predicted toxin-antitoxin system